uniref:DUF2157 domain-containing protein n=1 Tax=Roseihalotalea indica TaxID=2867963 RepID=A0AA49JDU7_9BACT|nr:DUF2157 domain-containing protein [Tunicatimonas sp. TK19036]
MQFTEQQHQTLKAAIKHWEDKELISTATAETLRQSYQIKITKKRFDWKNLSFIAFFFSIACIVLATVLFLLDDWLMSLVSSVLGASDFTKFLMFAVLAAITFAGGAYRRKNFPNQRYSNEVLLIFGAVFIAFALTYLSDFLGMENGYFPIFVGIAAVLYGGLAIYLRSQLMWGLTLTALAVWYGTDTSYRADWEPYFWGMNFPLRYILFGVFLVLVSFLVKKHPQTQPFFSVTYYSGMIVALISLWLLSIFGNHGSLTTWSDVSQLSFLYAAILLALASVGAILWGLHQQERLTVEIGIVFLLMDIYTRYFEYGWENLHRVVFFAVLATSFWLIGKKAENLWNMIDKE